MIDHGILSPSGRVSKRSRKLAQARVVRQLWPNGCTREDIQGTAPQNDEKESLLRYARTLRDLASKGMHPRKYAKEAARLEALAAGL